MLRLSAKLHSKYNNYKDENEVLNLVNSFDEIDPFSGKPFVWDKKKQLLYSLGSEGEDNGGGFISDCDIPLRLVLKQKKPDNE